MKRVLVTGGTGVTGVALVRYLLAQNLEVIAIVRPGSFREKYLPLENPNLKVIHYALPDILDAVEELKELGCVDVFYHLAWEGSTISDKQGSRDNMQLQSRNVVYSVDAADLCRLIECPVFVMTGSQAEYGDSDEAITESFPPRPLNGYGNAKLCAENMTRIMCRNYGIRHVVARLFSVYGPYDGTNSMINTCILKLIRGERPEYTAGEQKWNYLYSFDAAKAIYLLSRYGKDGEYYNVASPEEAPLKTYIFAMHQVVNPNVPAVFGEKDYPGGVIKNMQADVSKLIETTGFTPDYDFRAGIMETANWCIESNEEYIGGVENKLEEVK